MSQHRQPSIYVTHGGGPLPLMGDASHTRLVQFLQNLPSTLTSTPKALVIISAHWHAETPTVGGVEKPPLIFDYYGFPENTYHFKYPAPGSPAIAKQAETLLTDAGFKPASSTRGWDHGVFVPLMLAFPNAEIPVVQISMMSNFDPDAHFRLGRALRPLRDQGALIIGSGSSYHNMRGFKTQDATCAQESAAFDRYLIEALGHSDAATRKSMLMQWESAPYARECHPPGGEEHLVPLFVVAGAAHDDEAADHVYADNSLMGMTVSGWQFGK